LEGGEGKVEDLVGFVEGPIGAVVEEPATGGEVAELVAVLGDKTTSVTCVGELVGIEVDAILNTTVGYGLL